MNYTLENQLLSVTVSSLGAELTDIVEKSTGLSFMWNAGDAWKRHAPILFPIVGGLKNKSYILDGKKYHMGQHGFARDTEFQLYEKTDDSITFLLESSDETKTMFPCDFKLYLSFTLKDRTVTAGYRVENPSDSELLFQIGGHPAFTCPLTDDSQTSCFLKFDENTPLTYNLLSDDGLCLSEEHILETQDSLVPVTEDFFDNDALIFYNDRCRSIGLCGSDHKEYLRVTFDAPVYGIWSAKGKHAPFICIEPWYGRCDDDDFSGTWQERKFMNRLSSGEIFEKNYTIEIRP